MFKNLLESLWCDLYDLKWKLNAKTTKWECVIPRQFLFIHSHRNICSFYICSIHIFPVVWVFWWDSWAWMTEHLRKGLNRRKKTSSQTKSCGGRRELKSERKQIDNANEYVLNHRKLIYSNWLHGRLGSNFFLFFFRYERYNQFWRHAWSCVGLIKLSFLLDTVIYLLFLDYLL